MYGSVSCLQIHACNFCIRMGWMNSQRYQWFWCERRAVSSLDALDIWVGVNLSRIGKVVVSYMSLTAWRCFHVWRCFLVQLGREVLEIFSLFSVNIKMLCYARIFPGWLLNELSKLGVGFARTLLRDQPFMHVHRFHSMCHCFDHVPHHSA